MRSYGMNKFTEIRTVDSSPLMIQLPKELLKVPVKITVEPAKKTEVSAGAKKVLKHRRFFEAFEHPIKVDKLVMPSRDALYDR